jgi:phosphoribosylamine--glycine ligase
MTTQKVLVVGAGGREHALAWALARSPEVAHVYVAPGNAGTTWQAQPSDSRQGHRAPASNVPITAEDTPNLLAFAREHAIDLTVIGPEAPLAAGIVDAFQAAGLPCFGPCAAAAQLEASKAFAKRVMQAHRIPTARYGTFQHYDDALAALARWDSPVVIKADGLAAGKGVVVCDDTSQAQVALQRMLADHEFGAAGNTVIIEERLQGPELSLLALSDGTAVVPLLPARDHKRAYADDQGPNTGGMGAYAPVPGVDPTLVEHICQTILQPTIAGMVAQGTPYIGVLYAGLILTPQGPQVLEFNCRFGDPETQAILPLLATDGDGGDSLFAILRACVSGQLKQTTICWRPGACATVILAAPGYPGSYPKGLPISGVDHHPNSGEVLVFHAGTTRQNNQLVTSGGRVLAVSGLGPDLPAALASAYHRIQQIHFEGMHYRPDIGAHHQ